MHAFHFGSASRRLFGIYHPAAGSRPAGCGVVICQPHGHEYIRAHRALRNLSARLAGSGVHVLRFDYFGTGDSFGDGHEATLAQWRHDVAAAIDELKDMAELTRVSLVGVRIGALLAGTSAATRKDVEALVLWDPVLDGGEYLQATRELQARWVASRPWMEPAPRREDPEIIGFPLPRALEDELRGASLLQVPGWPRRVAVLSSQGTDASRLVGALQAAGVPSSLVTVPCDCEWQRASAVHLTLLAHDMVQEVVRHIASRVEA